jgi:hypothetical protein
MFFFYLFFFSTKLESRSTEQVLGGGGISGRGEVVGEGDRRVNTVYTCMQMQK